MTVIRTSLLAAAFCAGLAGVAAAAPLGGVGDTGASIKSEATKNIDNVRWSCWWHRGHKHCGWVRPQIYGYYWAPPRPRFWAWYGHRRWR